MISRITLFTLLCLMACYGPKKFLNQGAALQKSYATEIPIERVKDWVVIPVQFKGKQYRFLFDTGAPVMLRSSLFRQQKRQLASIPVSDVNKSVRELAVAMVDSLQIGEVIFDGVPALELEEDGFFVQCFGFDGIIGSNLVRDAIVEIDVEQSVLRLTNDPQKLPKPKSDAIPMRTDLDQQSSPIITIQLGDKVQEMLIFDSGADVFYDVGIDHFRTFAPHHIFDTLATAQGFDPSMGLFSAGDSSQTYLLSPKAFQIGTATFQDVICKVDFEDDSRLGAALFDHGLVRLDYQEGAFYFTPYGKSNSIAYAEREFALAPTFNGQFIVGYLYQDLGPVQAGDRILKVNDFATDQVGICDLFQMPSFSSHETIMVTVEAQDGSIHEVQVPRIQVTNRQEAP